MISKRRKGINWLPYCAAYSLLSLSSVWPATAHATNYEEYPSIRLRSLDKITARTLTFDAQVGTTIKFGDIYIKIQSCRKPPPVEKSEAAAFLQIWQVDKTKEGNGESRWIYSGWMFASSPALAGMDHPVYDVWVIDCLGRDPEAPPVVPTAPEGALPDEGTVPEGSAPVPTSTPEEQKPEQKPEQPAASTDDIPTDTDNTATDDAPSPSTSESTPPPSVKPTPAPTPDSQPKKDDKIDGIY